jgi:hypothetical protein
MRRLAAALATLTTCAAVWAVESASAEATLGAGPASVGFERAADGVRLVVNGVRVGSTDASALRILGGPDPPGQVCETVLAGPAGTRVRAAWRVEEGRVRALDLDVAGAPWDLMRAWVEIARSAKAAGESCGPSACQVRDRAGGDARLVVERVSSWPVRLALRDEGPVRPGEEPGGALAR